MGKIVALGGGRFDNGEMTNVAEHIISLSGKTDPLILFIPTASFDSDYLDSDEKKCFESLGVNRFDQLLLSKEATYNEAKEKIMKADIIYVGGGNLDFLTTTWKETGADHLLKEAFEKGTVLSGVSSGAMCWFREGYDDCGENGSFVFRNCLGLIPYTSCPHYQSENWKTFAKAISERNLSGVAMDNGAAFCYSDGKYYTISGNEDGDCYFYDREENFLEHNLTKEPQLLEILQKN